MPFGIKGQVYADQHKWGGGRRRVSPARLDSTAVRLVRCPWRADLRDRQERCLIL